MSGNVEVNWLLYISTRIHIPYHVRDELIVASTGAAGTRGNPDQSGVGQSVVHTPLSDEPRVVVVSGVHEYGVGHRGFEDRLCWVGKEAGNWISAILVDQSPLLSGIVGTQSLCGWVGEREGGAKVWSSNVAI